MQMVRGTYNQQNGFKIDRIMQSDNSNKHIAIVTQKSGILPKSLRFLQMFSRIAQLDTELSSLQLLDTQLGDISNLLDAAIKEEDIGVKWV